MRTKFKKDAILKIDDGSLFLNVDANIAPRVIAERLMRMLPGLIHENQSRYVPGRNICDNICSIIDLMAYTKDKSKPGILFFIDFEKAFASLECDFLLF